jgi:protein-tyrosine phosphatase family protein
LSLADSTKDTITLDYVLTRIGVEREREFLVESLKKWLGEDALSQPGANELGSVSSRVINEFQDHVQKKYGGAKGYCKNVLGLKDEDISAIVKNLTTQP